MNGQTPANVSEKVLTREDRLVAADLEAWLGAGGGVGLERALDDAGAILPTIEAAGLRGMGGAGFPTARKWKFVATQARGTERHLIANANEDEPGTLKDQLLLEQTPHGVIEGALIAALATGINNVVLYINPREEVALRSARQALEQWRIHPLFSRVDEALDNDHPLSLSVVESSGLYIGGEETAAIAAVAGGFPFPRKKPPFPAAQGLHDEPTLVNNVETLANVPHILAQGADWYHALGRGDAYGTKLFTLSGDVLTEGVFELPMGVKLRELIDDYGNGMLEGKKFKAVFTGGPSNTILTANDLDVPLDWDSVRARKSSLGTGAMIVISEGTGIVKRVTEYIEFFAENSCGQCPSCKIGTRQLASLLTKIDTGRGMRSDLENLAGLCEMLPGSGRCGLIGGAVTVVESSLLKFIHEYEAHLLDP